MVRLMLNECSTSIKEPATSKPNQSEISLIARQLVKDHMSGNQEMPHTLVISPKLRTAVKGARLQYEYAQEQERKAKAKAANEPLKKQQGIQGKI